MWGSQVSRAGFGRLSYSGVRQPLGGRLRRRPPVVRVSARAPGRVLRGARALLVCGSAFALGRNGGTYGSVACGGVVRRGVVCGARDFLSDATNLSLSDHTRKRVATLKRIEE